MCQAQQDDLTALGRLALALACRTIHCDNLAASMELVARTYSADLKNLILYDQVVTFLHYHLSLRATLSVLIIIRDYFAFYFLFISLFLVFWFQAIRKYNAQPPYVNI